METEELKMHEIKNVSSSSTSADDNENRILTEGAPRRLNFNAISNTLREDQVQRLLEYAHSSSPPAVWIEAEAGVGKSTLLAQFRHALHSLSLERQAVVIQGKFEERAAASEPFAALRDAVSELVEHVLSLDHDERTAFAGGLKAELDTAFGLLVGILPDIRRLYDEEHVQGETKDHYDDDDEEDAFGDFSSKEYRFERFRLAFRSLIRFTCSQLQRRHHQSELLQTEFPPTELSQTELPHTEARQAAIHQTKHRQHHTELTRTEDHQTTLHQTKLWQTKHQSERPNGGRRAGGMGPLVLMLDDFHSIDPDSLQIVKTLMEDPKKPNNFFLVTATRPLDGYAHINQLYTAMTTTANANTTNTSTMIKALAGGGSSTAFSHNSSQSFSVLSRSSTSNNSSKIRIMGVPRLSVAEIASMLRTLLFKENSPAITQLAGIVKAKTQGNSFVVLQFLRLLERSGHFQPGDGLGWQFDLEAISLVDRISDKSVAEVVAHNLETSVNKRRRSALMVAASFGVSRFDVSTIVHAVTVLEKQEQPQADVEEYEDPYVVRQRMSDMSCELTEAAIDGYVEETSPGHFRFAHDRIRESAYALLPPGPTRKQVHWKVGRQLRSWMDTQSELGLGGGTGFSKESLLLHATKQLNAGADLIEDDWELLDLADLNYQAAELAARKSAFYSSMEYLQVGLSHLGSDAWDRQYERTLRFSVALMRVQYSCGLLDDCWETSGVVIQHAKTFADASRVYITRVLSLMQSGLNKEALELVLEVFELMGKPMPKRFVLCHVLKEFLKARSFLKDKSDEEIINLPAIFDEALEIDLDFSQYLAEIGFLGGKFEYVLLVSFRYLNLMAERGNYPRSFFATQLYACFFKTQMGEFDKAMRYGMLAKTMSSNAVAATNCKNIPGFAARSDSMFYSYVHHWQAPIRESLVANRDAFRRLWQCGLVDTALMDASTLLQHLFAAGEPLSQTLAVCAKHSEAFEDYQQMTHWGINASQHQAMLNLQQVAGTCNQNPAILSGEIMDVDVCLENWTKKGSSNPPAVYNAQFWSMVLAYHFGDLERAKHNIKAMRADLFEDASCVLVPLRPFYTALVYFALLRKSGKSKYRRKALASLKILKQWAGKGAVNCIYMCHVLEAEHVGLLGARRKGSSNQVEATIEAYDKAIESATKLELCHHMALANELAGIYLIGQDDNRAVVYLHKAIDLYQQWGAMAIVRDMVQTRFRSVLLPKIQPSPKKEEDTYSSDATAEPVP